MAHSAYVQLEPKEIADRAEKAYPGGGELVTRAYAFAEKAHDGQMRKSGEKYIVHPLFVASILTDLVMDPPTIAAALLHDTLEDCEGVTPDILREEFGEEVLPAPSPQGPWPRTARSGTSPSTRGARFRQPCCPR